MMEIKTNTSAFNSSMPTNLPLGNRPHPNERQIDPNSDNPNDPKHLPIIHAIEAENDGENNPPDAARTASEARNQSVGMGMHVGDEGEDGAVGRLQEERHPRHEPEHGALGVTIRDADGDLEDAGEDGEGVHEILLPPHAAALVDDVREDPAGGSEEDVQQPEHGRPSPAAGLAERFEVLEVVGAQDGVDGELGAEGAQVAAHGDEALEGEDDGEGFFESGFADDLPARRVQHLLLADLGFVVVV